jgi:hypothetical protein
MSSTDQIDNGASTFYHAFLARTEPEARRIEQVTSRVEIVRVLLVLGVIAVFALRNFMPTAVAWLIAAALTMAFVVAVRYHGRLQQIRLSLRRQLAAARGGIARAAHDWQAMPPLRATPPLEGWAASTANDLDITGHRSLSRLLDSGSLAGLERVLRWILGEPAATAQIAGRQQSVTAVRQHPELLLRVAADTRFAGGESGASLPQSFLLWCATSNEADTVRLRRLAWIPVAILIVVVVFLTTQGWSRANGLIGAVAVVNIIMTLRVQREIRANLGEFERALAFLRSTHRMLDILTSHAPLEGRLGEVQQQLGKEQALPTMRQLLRLLEWAEVRRSPMMHWALNATIGFDLHVAYRLNNWRTRHAVQVPEWLDVTADAGALFALGTIAFEHPTWTAPDVHDEVSRRRFAVTGLAHPLLDSRKAVTNDAALGSDGDVIVVSGANMAGKSTFLRAIGLNALMAQAGGMVAARSLELRRCRVRTSIHVEDDLGSGTSLFLAEVTRIKQIVDEARDGTRVPVLFILDEVLHGTNAKDRREASQGVLAQLRTTSAVGVVATHDPLIGAANERHMHFACRVTHDPDTGRIELVFDYRAREGPAIESNALAILELLGLSAKA